MMDLTQQIPHLHKRVMCTFAMEIHYRDQPFLNQIQFRSHNLVEQEEDCQNYPHHLLWIYQTMMVDQDMLYSPYAL